MRALELFFAVPQGIPVISALGIRALLVFWACKTNYFFGRGHFFPARNYKPPHTPLVLRRLRAARGRTEPCRMVLVDSPLESPASRL